MASVNLHLYPSVMTHDSRMARVTKAMAEWHLFDHIYIVGMADGEHPLEQPLQPGVTIQRVPVVFPNSASLFVRLSRFISWYVGVIIRFGRKPARCINCHSLSALPLGTLLKFLTGGKLIYDTRELETETPNMVGVRKVLAKHTEAFFIRYIDQLIVVGPRIGGWYKERYPWLAPAVIRNLPEMATPSNVTDAFRCECNIPADHLIFFYLGAISVARGIAIILEAFRQAPDHCHVVFLGSGPFAPLVEEHASRYPNIHHVPRVPPSEIRRYTESGDVGLCVIEPICLSYEYSFPNKLFEYLASGAPVIVTDLPDMSGVVAQSGGGWVIRRNDPSDLLKVVKSITKEDVRMRAENARRWSSANTWEAELSSLHRVYKELGFTPLP